MKLTDLVYDIQVGRKHCSSTILFLEGELSSKEYQAALQSSLNEAVFDLSAIREKVLNALATLVVKVQNAGTAILSKAISAITAIVSVVKRFSEKHPNIYRAILIFIVLMIILVFFASTAKAASSGDPSVTINKSAIDAAIGLLRKMKGEDDMVTMKAISYLTNLRDGNVSDAAQLGKEAIDVANAAVSTINKIASEQGSDPAIVKQIYTLAQQGQEVVGTIYNKVDSTETIKLILKEGFTV
jgi:hypothetical protein